MTQSTDKVERGRRLARDLRRIRQARGIGADVMLTRIKASPDVFDSFEQTTLIDHPRFNRVYIRSFVRAYAEAVDIDPEITLRAFEAAVDGRYSNELAVRYLGEPAADLANSSLLGTSTFVFDSEQVSLAEEDAESLWPTGDQSTGEVDAGTSAASTEAEEESEKPAASARGDAEDVVWPAVPTPSEKSRSKGRWTSAEYGSAPVLPPTWLPHMKWIVPVAGVLLVVLIWVLMNWLAVPGAGPEQAPPPAPVDTVQAFVPPAATVLPDSFDVWIVAARDTLNPITVSYDAGQSFPRYWVEPGDTLRLRITDRVAVQNRIEAVDVYIEGYPMPTRSRDTRGHLVLDRTRAETAIDSLKLLR